MLTCIARPKPDESDSNDTNAAKNQAIKSLTSQVQKILVKTNAEDLLGCSPFYFLKFQIAQFYVYAFVFSSRIWRLRHLERTSIAVPARDQRLRLDSEATSSQMLTRIGSDGRTGEPRV